MPGLFHEHEDDARDVRFVVNVLDMWSFLEAGYGKLTKKDRDQLQVDIGPLGRHVKFMGFDGNNETELMSIARFLINEMNRFTGFKGRDLNSHVPTVSTYRQMYAAFEPIRKTLDGGQLSAAQLTKILQARLAT